MALIKIEYGSVADSATLNENFNYLDNRITDYSLWMGTINSTISSVNSSLSGRLNESEKITLDMFKQYRQIGDPVFRMSDELFDGEIRLEGAEVSREEYFELFEVYGITYGEGNGSTTFNLPDFRNRVIWGGEDYGYIEAGLPNITATLDLSRAFFSGATGSFTVGSRWTKAETDAHEYISYNRATFDASRSSGIYSNSATVQPPAVKVRVITRYK